MLFNSIEFAIFLPIVFLLYWFVVNKNLNLQNVLLLIASYSFYGWWDWRFLFLLFSISVFNFYIGIKIDKNETDTIRKKWLILGLIINIGVLGIFKYYNFFINSFIDLASLIGYNLPKSTTKIILPLGISFYMFLSMSYIIDIYKKILNADRNIIHILLTLSFFPIILAGPIQRPISLLPQIRNRRDFTYSQALDGLRQLLWGLFVKIAIADKLAYHADNIFLNSSDYHGSTLLIGAIFYSIQIYADFSGYSNIAIGTAKLFGFSLMRNFSYPYFARDITEFWKRWHISLTTWFRDYVFLPLSFNISWKIKTEKVFLIKSDLFIYIVASIVVWFLTGLWHGANYTFITWGMIHGFFLIIYQWQRKPRKKLFKKLRINNDYTSVIIIETILTNIIVLLAWIFFRERSMHNAFSYIAEIFSTSLFKLPQIFPLDLVLLTLIFIFSEWLQRNKEHPLQIDNIIKYRFIRWGIYYAIVILIIILSGDNQQNFIYSQF
jgi:alginate O-acetyltransferase complex protein AlgI